jgi:ElaB/YqjD/DUF883 family membrane-anchored ribosome-binding protein
LRRRQAAVAAAARAASISRAASAGDHEWTSIGVGAVIGFLLANLLLYQYGGRSTR